MSNIGLLVRAASVNACCHEGIHPIPSVEAKAAEADSTTAQVKTNTLSDTIFNTSIETTRNQWPVL